MLMRPEINSYALYCEVLWASCVMSYVGCALCHMLFIVFVWCVLRGGNFVWRLFAACCDYCVLCVAVCVCVCVLYVWLCIDWCMSMLWFARCILCCGECGVSCVVHVGDVWCGVVLYVVHFGVWFILYNVWMRVCGVDTQMGVLRRDLCVVRGVYLFWYLSCVSWAAWCDVMWVVCRSRVMWRSLITQTYSFARNCICC